MRINIHRLCVIALAGMMAISASGSPQTSSPSIPNNFPQGLWLEHKKVTQIPWTFVVGKPTLRADFRQELSIGVEIRREDLEKLGIAPDLVLYIRVLDGSTVLAEVSSDDPNDLVARSPHEPITLHPGEPLVVPEPEFRIIGSAWTKIAIARPGKYKLELAVFDQSSGRHSTRYEDILIPGNENEPLEKALRGLPRFEFGERSPVPRIVKPVTVAHTSVLDRAMEEIGLMIPTNFPSASRSGFDVLKEPSPPIPVDRPGALHLSVVTILSPPDSILDSDGYLSSLRENLTGILSAFLRLDVLRGTAKLSAVDLTNRRLVIDRQNLKVVPLETIKSEIEKDTNTVSLDALAGARDSGRFFRDVLRAQFEAAENDTEGAPHVIIIVAPRTELSGVSNLQPLTPVRDCHCRVIYLHVASPNGSSDIDDLLKAYKPQIFEPLSWPEFRKDFGTIYQQLLR